MAIPLPPEGLESEGSADSHSVLLDGKPSQHCPPTPIPLAPPTALLGDASSLGKP